MLSWRCGDKRSSPKGSSCRSKTKNLECQCSDTVHEVSVEVRLHTQAILKRYSFKYLGTEIQGSGDINNDVTHRIGVDEVEACLLVLV